MRLTSLITGLCLLLAATTTRAQEWSAAQKEVWKDIQAYWDLADKGDVEGYLSYYHEDYKGWAYNSPVPTDKAVTRKVIGHFFKVEKPELSWVHPVSIQIIGDVAIVHYYFALHYRDEEGNVQNDRGRWTDVLVKQGPRWMVIADHGGTQPSGN